MYIIGLGRCMADRGIGIERCKIGIERCVIGIGMLITVIGMCIIGIML